MLNNYFVKVAVDRTSPHGLVVGIDVIPARPPTGVSTIQGNFLSAAVQDEVMKFLRASRQIKRERQLPSSEADHGMSTGNELDTGVRSYLEQEKQSGVLAPESLPDGVESTPNGKDTGYVIEEYLVDVVLSDMSAPWDQTEGFWKRSLSDPYHRMMNTSGINIRDHAGSMVC